MVQLHQDKDKFSDLNTKVIIIAPENMEDFNKFWKKNEYTLTGIPDPKGNIRKLYGQEFKVFKLGTMPAQILVDKSGTIRYVNYGESMSDITEDENILELIKEINEE